MALLHTTIPAFIYTALLVGYQPSWPLPAQYVFVIGYFGFYAGEGVSFPRTQ